MGLSISVINQSSTVTIVSPGLSGWLNIYGGYMGYMGDFPEDAKMIKIGHFCCCRIRASLWTNGLFIFLSFLNYFEDILDKMTHFPLPRKMTNMYIWKPGAVWNRTCILWVSLKTIKIWEHLGISVAIRDLFEYLLKHIWVSNCRFVFLSVCRFVFRFYIFIIFLSFVFSSFCLSVF